MSDKQNEILHNNEAYRGKHGTILIEGEKYCIV
jgi:hypothetical protein